MSTSERIRGGKRGGDKNSEREGCKRKRVIEEEQKKRERKEERGQEKNKV